MTSLSTYHVLTLQNGNMTRHKGGVKMAFIQKVLIYLPFPQTDKPYYFPELEF